MTYIVWIVSFLFLIAVSALCTVNLDFTEGESK